MAKGVSQTSIQDDFYRELTRLKLDQFKASVKRELDLDLRENRRVKTAEAAFLDLHRSSFLHRLAVLEVGFGQQLTVRQEGNDVGRALGVAMDARSGDRHRRGGVAR